MSVCTQPGKHTMAVSLITAGDVGNNHNGVLVVDSSSKMAMPSDIAAMTVLCSYLDGVQRP